MLSLTKAQLIAELYIGYFNRAPDPEGLNFWLNALTSGVSLDTVADDFANSSESQAAYPYLASGGDPTSFVTAVYNNILNRAPDAEGLDFWVGELKSGTVTPGAFIATLEASVNMQTGTQDAMTLANKVTVAVDYANRLSSAGVNFTGDSAHAVLAPVTSDPGTVATGEAVTTALLNPTPPVR